MAIRYVSLERTRRFRVTCDSCDLDRDFLTEQGASTAADLHEIETPLHNCDVAVLDQKPPKEG
ncbi:MAG: hypothetical protein AB1753_08425 [Thermoproteota archaeon]